MSETSHRSDRPLGHPLGRPSTHRVSSWARILTAGVLTETSQHGHAVVSAVVDGAALLIEAGDATGARVLVGLAAPGKPVTADLAVHLLTSSHPHHDAAGPSSQRPPSDPCPPPEPAADPPVPADAASAGEAPQVARTPASDLGRSAAGAA